MAIGGSIPRILFNSTVATALTGCFFPVGEDPAPPTPEDIRGTLTTARKLVLGGSVVVGAEGISTARLCVSPDGMCIPAEYRVDECYFYDNIHAFVGEIEVPRVSDGGWSPVQRYQPLPSGGNGHGCNYPRFGPIEFENDGASGPQEITIRVGEDEVTLTAVDWLARRTLRVPENTLVAGSDTLIEVTPLPSQAIRDGTGDPAWPRVPVTFINYEDSDVANEWCLAKREVSGYSTEGVYCSSPSIEDIAPEDWTDAGFVFHAPRHLTPGVGQFGFNELNLPTFVAECPFASCELVSRRSTFQGGITVQECQTCPDIGEDCSTNACIEGLHCIRQICTAPVPIGDPCPEDLDCLDRRGSSTGSGNGNFEVTDPLIRCDYRTYTCEAQPIPGETCGEVVPGDPASEWACQIGSCSAQPGEIGECVLDL